MKLYKPNKAGKGHAIGLRFNSQDQNLFLSIVKQTGFSENGKGTFNGGKQCLVALGAHEIGGILAVIHGLNLPVYVTEKTTLQPTRHKQEYHHESEKQSTKLTFAPYITPEGEVRGLSISVHQTLKENKEATSYSFWAGIDEMFRLEKYLGFVLDHFDTAEYSREKKEREKRFKERQNSPKTIEETGTEQSSELETQTENVADDANW